MTNIWAQSFEDVRKPFFEMEDPYTLREKKEKESNSKRWWDDDGDGVGYEEGEVKGKFKKKKVKEEVEEIDEISTGLAGKVVNARIERTGAAVDRENKARTPQNVRDTVAAADKEARSRKLAAGVRARRAANEEYMDEAQEARNNPEKYEAGEKKKYAPVRGEKRPMPPRGNKDREAFEKWYRANVKEETLVEVDKKKETKEKTIDVMSGKNKVTVNPQFGAKNEEVEAWVGELVEEGYDLSQFTWDEMSEIYESVDLNEGSSEIPPQGDAQRVSVTSPQVASKKRTAAQAQIRADMDRIQLQKASATTKESFESIVEYLSTREDAFKNLEEGVFDPKKSKMRSASERSERSMTDAQRKAAKKESERVAAIHSKGETALAGMRTQGKKGKVQTTPTPKSQAPAANRQVKGRYDKLAKAASKVLKDINR
jgi:hypothetical protein